MQGGLGEREAGGKMGRQPSGGFGGEELVHSFLGHPHVSSASPVPSPSLACFWPGPSHRKWWQGLKGQETGGSQTFSATAVFPLWLLPGSLLPRSQCHQMALLLGLCHFGPRGSAGFLLLLVSGFPHSPVCLLSSSFIPIISSRYPIYTV